jgi:hypothetical protein
MEGPVSSWSYLMFINLTKKTCKTFFIILFHKNVKKVDKIFITLYIYIDGGQQ